MKDAIVKIKISLEDFDYLRNFEKEIKSGKSYSFYRVPYSEKLHEVFLTENEMIERAYYINEELKGDIKVSERMHKEEIFELAKMSIWEFIKWRKSTKKG